MNIKSSCKPGRTGLAIALLAGLGSVAAAEAPSDYRTPSADVTALLTAPTPPEPLLHVRSHQVALLYREPVMSMERLARPWIGLGGYRFDPVSQTSGVGPLVTQVEVLSADKPNARPVTWQPSGDQVLNFVRFSPDGRTLSAVAVPNAAAGGPAKLLLFDIASGKESVAGAAVNAAYKDPCRWTDSNELWCLVVPADRPAPPPAHPAPLFLEHSGEALPLRTYQNTLENSYDDELFDYYFTSALARVDRGGRATPAPGIRGVYSSLEPSPDGKYVILTHVLQPYPRLVPVYRFPSSVELWDLGKGTKLYASRPEGFGLEETDADDEEPHRGVWMPGADGTLGFLEKGRNADGSSVYRWMTLAAPFGQPPAVVAESSVPIKRFGWTTAGTPWFSTRGEAPGEVRFQVVRDTGVKTIWTGVAANQYENPGRALRLDGADGPAIEEDGRIYLAGDGKGKGGPQPFLDVFDLGKLQKQRLYTAEPGVFEVVLGLLDADGPTFITSRETETESPNLYLVRGKQRTRLSQVPDPYPQLAKASRRVITYDRADGVGLSGTLYLPANYRKGQRLPTLVWIYPYEYTDLEAAEQLDIRNFRFHRVKGPSPLAAVVAGYAVVLNPTVPILYEGDAPTDNYIPQLVSSVEAAVDYLVDEGVTDAARVAVGGRSFGSFSSANLMIHSDRFATAVLMSGAYNRTLTPFGFQHEHRTFWDVTELYTYISPFFHANEFKGPVLLVHGGSDENAGTLPFQARRMFHGLMGAGGTARYVELPYEGHHYWGRDNVLLAAAEMLDWLDQTIGPGAASAASRD